jgi:hypothetical protein
MPDDYVSLTFDGVQEWVTGSGHTCYEPDYIFPYGESRGASTAYRGFSTAHDLECSLEEVDGVLPNGAITKTAVITARNSSFPDFRITFNLTTTDVEYTYEYAGVPTTGYVPYVIHYMCAKSKAKSSQHFVLNWQPFSSLSH